MRANLLVSNPTLAALVLGRPVERTFEGLPPAQQARLEALQLEFFELLALFRSAAKPGDFRRCYRRGKMPRDLTYADGMLRLVSLIQSAEAALSRHATGWVRHDGRSQPYAVDNPELRP